MSLTKIAIIGANGRLGPFILNSLLAHTDSNSNPTYKITVLNRASSKSTYPSTVTVHTIPDDLPHASLVSALTGQDVLVIAVGSKQIMLSLKLIDAAAEARVKRVIPNDFGSCDSSDVHTLTVCELYREKKRVRDYLVSLQEKGKGHEGLSWTSIVCGHFLGFGLRVGLMGMDVHERTARVFDGGDVPFSASMLRTVGEAVVGILRFPEETRNRIVYVQSVRTTQNQLLKVVEGFVGKGAFRVEERDSEEFIQEMQRKLEQTPEDHSIGEDLVMVEGLVNGDWIHRDGFVNGLFGLPDEDLEGLVRESLEGHV